MNGREHRRMAPLALRSLGRMSALALCGAFMLAAGTVSFAQGVSEEQMRCMQLQQELAAAQGGGGGREELGRIEQQIKEQDRIFQGTQAAMEDAGCYERLFIFGRALVRSPRCLGMNNRVEEARRQLSQLQQQRQAINRGGSTRRRQAELQDALARAGCGGMSAPRRGGGGLFDFFGGEDNRPTPGYQTSRIIPNAPYRTVCVRLCDGFYFPVSYSTYPNNFSNDVNRCQSSCAAPAELYVYRNPGEELEQAVSLNGAAYMDLPVALKYRKEYVKGCSCKQAEYNPTDIENANKKAEVTPGTDKAAAAAKPAAAPAATAEASAEQAPVDLDLDITGSTTPPAEPAAPAAPASAPAQQAQETPPPAAAETPPAASPKGQSTIAKRRPAPAPQ